MRGDLPTGAETGPVTPEPATRRRSRWVQAGAAVAALVALIGLGIALLRRDVTATTSEPVRGVSTSAAPADRFSAGEQRIVGLLPPGYTAGGCTRATNPFPHAIASLDCSQGTAFPSPTYARYTLYDDLDALTGDFQATADGMAVSPCPGGNTSPGTWYFDSDPGRIGGKVVCGDVEDRADIAWTRDAQLLLATINGGPDLDSLYQWWQRYGSTTQQ